MGQLLSSQVAADVQIPTLRNAFFVGDVLTKRDVRRLQGLARSVDIINMYGTTETQRSVSFYRIPSVAKDPQFLNACKDIMPAGQGMKDVQLLVVSRDGTRRVCGVGEIGEIFVRAGGLAEGYLALDDVTAQKFVKSWFLTDDHWAHQAYTGKGSWKGVRDRLYRSGDLGRYLPDGNGKSLDILYKSMSLSCQSNVVVELMIKSRFVASELNLERSTPICHDIHWCEKMSLCFAVTRTKNLPWSVTL